MRASVLSVLCGLSCAAAVGGCSRDTTRAVERPSAAASTQAALQQRVDELERTLASERAASKEETERLERELAEVRGRLTEREEEFLRTLQAVGTLAPAALPPGYVPPPSSDAEGSSPTPAELARPTQPGEPAGLGEPGEPGEPGESGESPELVAERLRAAERMRALRSLLAVENVSGLELLELGLWLPDEPEASATELSAAARVEPASQAPSEDPPDVAPGAAKPGAATSGATGPVVFRTLDDRGRPTGSLFAQRLRLEASQAARTVTIVLEDGYELRAGEKQLFERATDPNGRGGVRRIPLVHVDPAPWLAAVPELFRARHALDLDDDGTCDVRAVRVALNDLLAEDAAHGWWKLDELAGVVNGVLRKVALRKLDRDGRLERLLFADRLRIEPHGSGVALLLEDGAQLRGDEKAPFLDGRYRIFLPRAKLAEWRKTGLVGAAPGDAGESGESGERGAHDAGPATDAPDETDGER
ncbi:MAG: hypothetical protein L6Q99_00940 [Planctomycetes bacterium]|nr:hypothetical protein [Planctomycetota bacterium]